MIRHLLKLVWNRKRSTALLMLEIAISFLVVFAIAAFALYYLANWRRPLGYDWREVWAVEVDTKVQTDDEWTPEQVETLRQLLLRAASLPHVAASSGAFVVPFEFSSSNGGVYYGERSTMSLFNEVSDGFADTMGLELVAGRWFGREDDGAAVEPVVINRHLARELFGDQDPLGKLVDVREIDRRVVGVVEEFRQHGELVGAGSYLFQRVRLGDTSSRPPRRLLLRMAPGTPASYEQELIAALAPLAPSWSFEVAPLAQQRRTRLRLQMAPLVVGGVVAFFLLLMVGLGLLGVLWQNVTRRTRELGLRRATGASRAAIHRQILLELALVTSLALAPVLVLVLQLALLGLAGALGPAVFATAVVAAVLVIYGLALLCGLYPSAIAVRLEPADALRWE